MLFFSRGEREGGLRKPWYEHRLEAMVAGGAAVPWHWPGPIGQVLERLYLCEGRGPGRVPSQHGLPYRNLVLPPCRQGAAPTRGWYIPATIGKSAPLVVLMHGWRSAASVWLPLVKCLHAAGFTALLPLAQGHDGKGGRRWVTPREFVDDVINAMAWSTGGGGRSASAVALVGHSLGAVAVLAAVGREPVSAVVALSAYARARSPIEAGIHALNRRFFPTGWLVTRYLEWTRRFTYRGYDPARTAGLLDCPLLLFRGTADPMVGAADSAAILNACHPGLGHLLPVVGSGHDFVRRVGVYGPALLAFLRQHLPPPR